MDGLTGAHDAAERPVRIAAVPRRARGDLRVQLCTDLERMPIEDASVTWPEALSPFSTVARLDLPPQAGWNAALIQEIDDGTSAR